MKKIILSTILTVILSFSSTAQLSMDDIFIGGNVGAQFGQVTIVNLSPMIGYKFTDQTIAGVSVTYRYYKDSRYNPTLKTNIYGVGLFGRQYISDVVFLHAEYEGLNYEVFDSKFKKNRQWLFSGLVGGGIQQGPIQITALYVLNHDPDTSPYGPVPYVIRVGVGI